MKVVDNFYQSDNIRKSKVVGYVKKILKGRDVDGINLLIIRPQRSDLLEIVSTRELFRINERDDDVYVIGFAKEREDAFLLVERIFSEVSSINELKIKESLYREFKINE